MHAACMLAICLSMKHGPGSVERGRHPAGRRFLWRKWRACSWKKKGAGEESAERSGAERARSTDRARTRSTRSRRVAPSRGSFLLPPPPFSFPFGVGETTKSLTHFSETLADGNIRLAARLRPPRVLPRPVRPALRDSFRHPIMERTRRR